MCVYVCTYIYIYADAIEISRFVEYVSFIAGKFTAYITSRVSLKIRESFGVVNYFWYIKIIVRAGIIALTTAE